MPTLDELGQKVKAKYPGVYDDMPDTDVALKVQAKFPGKYDDFSEPTQADFADVTGGSSVQQAPPSLGDQLKQSFAEAGRNVKKYAWDIPTEVLDRPLRPIRESLQQGGITGEMLPDIAKQNFGRFGGGVAAGLEREVAPGLVSGENVAMMGAMGASPVAGAALLSKFGGEGAKQAIEATQAQPNETPEQAGSRFARGIGGAAMAVAPLAHVGSRFVREAVKPPEPLDFSSIRPEDLGAESRVPDTATAEGTPNVANARKAEAVAALEKFKNELPEPAEPQPFVPKDKGPGYIAPDVLAAQKFDIDPTQPTEFNRWVEENAPPGGYREIQDAAAEVPDATPLEIQEAAKQLEALDRSAAEGEPAAPAAVRDGEAGATAVGSLGDAARVEGERPAGEATRGPEPLEDGAPEAGNPRDVQGQGEAGQAAPGAEGVPVAADLASLPGGELRHNQATINEFRRMAGMDSIEESRFKTTEAAIKAEAEKNIGPIIRDLMKRKPGEPITAVENAAIHAYVRHLAENPSPEGAAVLDHLSTFGYEGRSAVGRALGFGGTAMDEFLTDPGKAVQAAMAATKGKMSQEAKMDVAALAQKAKVRKERIDATLAERTQAAISRLEAEAKASLDRMRHDIGKISVEDILKCR